MIIFASFLDRSGAILLVNIERIRAIKSMYQDPEHSVLMFNNKDDYEIVQGTLEATLGTIQKAQL
ncbi:hypothetical protein BH10CYA1_BH10CYA1_30980 [soil metagenome]